MYSQGEAAFKGALFHSREQLRISLSSATPKVEIDGNLKGRSDIDKKYVLMKKERKSEISNAAGSNPV